MTSRLSQITSTLETNLQAHGADEACEGIGVDLNSIHRAEFWKQFVVVNGVGRAAVFMNAFTCTNKKGVCRSIQMTRTAYTRGVREAKAIVALRAKREAEEAAAQVRERNTERNRKKREAKKRLRSARPTAARPAPVQ